jgi:chloramphenicol O-acetyltransferase type B
MVEFENSSPPVAVGKGLSGANDRVRSGFVGKSAVEVGRFTYGLRRESILQWGEGASLKVGSFCSIAPGLKLYLGGNHRVDWCTTFPFGHIFTDELVKPGITGHPATKGDVVIGNDVWIAEGVTVLSGVTIGDGAVIASTATVTRSVGPYEIWGGNPARLIRRRFPAEVAARLHALQWWDCSVGTIREMAPLLSQPPNGAVLDALEELARRDAEKSGPE